MTAPELVVTGNPADWLPSGRSSSCGYIAQADACPLPDCIGPVCARPNPPTREWLAVETLPVVRRSIPVADLAPYLDTGPLRAGDTVTLRSPSPVNGCGDPVFGDPAPFAEATVAEVLPIRDRHPYGPFTAADGYVVAIGDGTAQVWQCDGIPDGTTIDLPDAVPGGWAIRLTNVKETT